MREGSRVMKRPAAARKPAGAVPPPKQLKRPAAASDRSALRRGRTGIFANSFQIDRRFSLLALIPSRLKWAQAGKAPCVAKMQGDGDILVESGDDIASDAEPAISRKRRKPLGHTRLGLDELLARRCTCSRVDCYSQFTGMESKVEKARRWFQTLDGHDKD